MPKNSPLAAPTKIWLASCLPQPEVLDWKPEVLTQTENVEEVFHECEEFSLPPIETLNAIRLRWRVPDACPAEPDYYDCGDCEEWSDIDSTGEESAFAPSDVLLTSSSLAHSTERILRMASVSKEVARAHIAEDVGLR